MSPSSVTVLLKKRLWQWFGSESHPAEWDGKVYGGGKVSQRFWEYFIAIEMLDLAPDSVVIDIGGGSPATGVSIFPRLLASCGIRVIVLDKEFGTMGPTEVENITVEQTLATRETLAEQIHRHAPTHVSCISVLEHATAEQQRGIFEAIEDSFQGERAVFTVEFHETKTHWEQQLTTETLSHAVSPLRRYFLSRIEQSPMHSVNALQEGQRLWYPLALQFDSGELP